VLHRAVLDFLAKPGASWWALIRRIWPERWPMPRPGGLSWSTSAQKGGGGAFPGGPAARTSLGAQGAGWLLLPYCAKPVDCDFRKVSDCDRKCGQCDLSIFSDLADELNMKAVSIQSFEHLMEVLRGSARMAAFMWVPAARLFTPSTKRRWRTAGPGAAGQCGLNHLLRPGQGHGGLCGHL
jgi:hypothetical protein